MNGWLAIQAIRAGKIVRCMDTGAYYWRNDCELRCGLEPDKTQQSNRVDANNMLFHSNVTFEIYEPEPSELDRVIKDLSEMFALGTAADLAIAARLEKFAAAIIAEAKK